MVSKQYVGAIGPTEKGIWYERVCIMDGKTYRHELSLTAELFNQGLDCMQNGITVQEAFPTLAPQDREFILSGITPQRWDDMFPPVPSLDETRMAQILAELKPVIIDLFGDNCVKPFDLEGLTAEALIDYPQTDELVRSQARTWVKTWVEREGLLAGSINP